MIGRLGKHSPKRDPRTLRLARYVRDLAPAPSVCDWLSGITDWGVMGNVDHGDCVFAGGAHAVQGWSAATGPVDTLPDEIVLGYYSKWAGFDPENPATDNGYIELDFLNHWRQETYAGRELVAYADPEPGNFEHIRQAIFLFGGVYIGLALPLSAQQQDVWDVVGDPLKGDSIPNSWGGHAVWVAAYDQETLTCITWGQQKKMTWAFWNAYCDEAHALLSKRWLESAPADFRLGDLQADLALVTG